MSTVKLINCKVFFILATLIALLSDNSYAQPCSVSSSPSFSSGCSFEYFTSITASGTGVTSTLAYSGSSCTGITYYNDYPTQGITAPTGSTVTVHVSRAASTYTAYLSVYIDLNNDYQYQGSELVGSAYVYSSGITSDLYSFTVPTSGIVTGTNLHMRVFVSEAASGAPCNGNYGQAVDFYFNATCTTPTINATPSSGTICSGGPGLSITASGGSTYSWTPATGLSATTGATVTATPTVTTTYTVTGTSSGCSSTATATVSVNPAPSAISGMAIVCVGSTTTLSDAGGGTWSSGATGIATVGSTTGVVTGVSAGTATITYTLPTGCYTTKVVTVNALPPAISGTLSVCTGGTTTLSDGSGTWSVSNTSVATIGSLSGVVTGIAPGNDTITFTSGTTGCTMTAVVTVNLMPSSISGTLSVCAGATTTLSDASAGGTWTSGSPGIATVGSATGIVSGVSSGTATISYSIAGCSVTAVVSVNPLPSGITGIPSVCVGATTTLSDAGSGTWSAGTPGVATVGSASGVVTGVSAGISAITYTLPTGCYTTIGVFVSLGPSPISGTPGVCVGATTTLTDGSGTWSSGSTGIATIGSSTGVVTGVSAGTAVITFTDGGGCFVTTTVTVDPLPSGITGIPVVCAGSTTTLTDAGGGSWSSGATGIATVGSASGIVTGVSSGTAVITYTLSTGCYTTTSVTVQPLPSAISGTLSICTGGTTTLTDGGGGTWSSGAVGIATIGSASGIVTGITTGTAVITYILSTGCFTTAVVTVNPLPMGITGVLAICAGTTTSLSSTPGGTWSTGSTGIATVGSSSGIVTGVAGGVATISYTFPTGCSTTTTVTVNPLPSSIGGSLSVCVGSTTLLTDGGGGTWSSGATSIATIGSTSGLLTGISSGTATITYTLPTGCNATATVTVNPLPSGITGTSLLCPGSASTFSAPGGGTWSVGTTGVISVGSTSGVVTAIATGAASLTYTLPTGCSATTPISVNPNPAPIGGTLSVCPGLTTTLTDATTGGIWSSSAAGIATVGSLSGIVTGVSGGTAIVNYYVPSTGCSVSAVVTVNPAPAAISGITSVCIGLTTILADAGGGTWSSGSSGVATIGSATGTLTGVSAGTAIITYTLPSGCFTTVSVTVNTLPAPISGSGNVCLGSTTTLTDAGGGAWSSGAPGVATVGSTGVVTGVSLGTATITYSLGTGCSTIKTVTVFPLPSSISGLDSVCAGSTITLSDATTGGTWSSGAAGIATANSVSGIVTGISAGTTVIAYTLPTGCSAAMTVTVNPLPPAITGVMAICLGATSTLSDITTGGTWSSSAPAIAPINSVTGMVNSLVLGTANISYTLPTGCITRAAISVNPLPVAIASAASVCVGSSATVSDASAGGTWSSSNIGIATVGSASGLVLGVSSGTVTLTYTLSTGCFTTTTFTVNPLPASITGGTVLCVGATSTLSDATTGGTWSSSNTSIAPIGSASGIVTGTATGTATITYTAGTGCRTTTTVSVTPLPSAITGAMTACVGGTTTLTSSGGGTWTSGAPGIAAVGSSSGVVTAISAGTATITYTIGTGCFTTATVTVNVAPAPISGSTTICVGTASTLSDAITGGTWTSSNSIAPVGATSGVVTGLAAGTATITYAIGGCRATIPVTVIATPSPVSGVLHLCVGGTTTLTDAGGGTWSSGATGIATVGSSTGIVTGVALGTATITYTLSSGCTATAVITVNSLPAPIAGTLHVCVGATTTLTEAGGGTWSSGAAGVATIGSGTGIVIGISAGTANITYSLGGGCNASAVVTVNPLPSAITGVMSVCIGATTSLSSTPGGTWSSGAMSIATVGSTGIVTGISAGTAPITYTLPTGCGTTAIITVNPFPSSISGSLSVCAGATTHLTDAGGGAWSSGAAGVATVGSSTGIVTGITAGTSVITYSLGTGCSTTATVTVNPLPLAITGTASACIGGTTTLADASGGGTWSSGATGIASVGSGSGVVFGIASGVAAITYRLSTGCFVTQPVTVNAAPGIISGSSGVCAGLSITLTDATPGGIWTSSNPSVATIGSSTGAVSGIAAGTTTISYIAGTGCAALRVITVNALPPAISGSLSICEGLTGMLADVATGGAWSSSNTRAAIDTATGVITAITAGLDTVTYTMPAGCAVTTVVTVNPGPSVISGVSALCVGSVTTFIDATTGGTWSSSVPAIATITSAGVLSGISSGTAIVSYTISTGCSRAVAVVVNPVSLILGSGSVCVGQTINLDDTTLGGSWTSSDTSIASIDYAGVVTGVSSGTATITYTLPTSCAAFKTITVNPLPSVITGMNHACAGQTSALADATTGGSWSSSNIGIAPVSVSGIVSGASAGVAIIIYALPTGCIRTDAFTVNPLPAAIAGSMDVCIGSTISLSDPSRGGTWSSSSSLITIGSPTGVVTGIAAGTALVTYTLPTGCQTNATVTINSLPAAITGAASVCVGSTTTLSNASPGGTWTSGNTSVATVDPFTGVMTGVAAGTSTITYTLGTGCMSTISVTVNTLPAGIAGSGNVCTGSTITLTDASAGGTWISGTTSIATVGSSSGIVTGIASGVSVIVYSLGTGCSTSFAVVVDPLPLPISGPNNVCAGGTITLSSGTFGGTWASADTAKAIIDTFTGVVTARAAGVVLISYTAGCTTTYPVTVDAIPSMIAGPSNACLHSTVTLYDSVSGGTWTSTNTSIATVGSSSGVVTGVALGSATIVYTMPGNCAVTKVINVIPLPAVFTVTGGGSHCAGDTGVHVGLNGSALLTNYYVYNGAAPVGAYPGAGTAMDLGLFTVRGTYTVVAVSSVTGCSVTMAGSASIGVIPTVTPSTTILSLPGDTVCAGASVTFTASPINGGSSPAYTWSINSHPVAAASSYTYIPADGDTVQVQLTSNATCAVPATVKHSVVMSVEPFTVPAITIAPAAGDTVCKGYTVTINTTPHFGGSAPVYQWFRNNAPLTGAGSSFTFLPNDGDIVYCVMNSNYACRLNNSDTSAPVIIHVDTPLYPAITINANPGVTIGIGQSDTLTAVAPNAINPTYQWYVNGIPVPGATSAQFVSSNFSYPKEDSVSCAVTSNGICTITAHQWVYIRVRPVSVPQVTTGANVRIMPNPNKGDFVIEGSLGVINDEEVAIELTDVIGQVIYHNTAVAKNGQLHEHIVIGNAANGMYLLTLRTQSEKKVFHVVIEQ